MERGLLHFQSLVCDSTVSIFADNSQSRGTRSPALNTIAQQILRWAESHSIILALQFIMGRSNILADALLRPNQTQGSEWTLKMEVFFELWKQWPVMVDVFATSANHHCPQSPGDGHGCSAPLLGQPSGLCFSSKGPHSSGPSEAQGVLRSTDDVGGSVLASTSLVPGPSRSGSGSSDLPSTLSRTSQTAEAEIAGDKPAKGFRQRQASWRACKLDE